MRPLIAAATIALALSACTGNALARPADQAPQPDGTAGRAQTSAAASAPTPPASDGIGAVTIALLGSGGVLALGGAGAIGALVGRRHQSLNAAVSSPPCS
jgi:hypothetical protein